MARFVMAAMLAFLPALSAAGECDRTGQVSVKADGIGVRSVLRILANQSGRNIAIRTNVRGTITIDLKCVDFDVALREVLVQAHATYSEAGGTILVVRRKADCDDPQPAVDLIRAAKN